MELADWMSFNKISDDDLSEQVGVSRSYISRVRRGLVHPNLGVALNIWAYSGHLVALDSMLPAYLRVPYQQRWSTPDNARKPPARRASKSRASA